MKGSKWVALAIVATVLFFLQFAISGIGSYAAGFFVAVPFDRDGLFVQRSVHHLVQMALALIVIFGLHRGRNIKGFKLAPRYDWTGVKCTLIFCGAILLYYLAVFAVGHSSRTIQTFTYELTGLNIAGTLGFQLFLSGPSEEILFRSLPIVLFLHILKVDCRLHRNLAIVLAAVLFGLAHINFFNCTMQLFQVCYAFVLGLAYGYVFIKSNSVIYPMIMHSMSNVISVGGTYLYMLFANGELK